MNGQVRKFFCEHYIKLKYTTKSELSCSDEYFKIQKEEDYSEVLVKNNIIIRYQEASLFNFLYYSKILEVFKNDFLPPSVRNSQNKINIVLQNEPLSFKSGKLAFVSSRVLDTIYVNTNTMFHNPYDKVQLQAKNTLAHEYYHLYQNNYMGCSKIKFAENYSLYFSSQSKKADTFIETTADMFAIADISKELNNEEVLNVVGQRFGSIDDDFYFDYLNQNGPGRSAILLDYYASYVGHVLFDENKVRTSIGFGETGYRFSSPTTSLRFSADSVFKYYADNLHKLDLYPDKLYAPSLLNDFGRTIGSDYKDILLSATREMSLKSEKWPIDNSPYSDTLVYKYLKNPKLTKDWTSRFEERTALKDIDNIKVHVDAAATNVNGEEVIHSKFSIPSFSGAIASYEYDEKSFGQGLLNLGMPHFLILSNQLDNDLALEITDKQDGRDYNSAYIKEWTTSDGTKRIFHVVSNLPQIGIGSTSAPANFEHPVHAGKLVLVSSNSSSLSKDISLDIKPACKVIDRNSIGGLGKPFMISCTAGANCWNGFNALSFFSCNRNEPVWSPGNCIAPKMAHPLCRKKDQNDNNVNFRVVKNGIELQLLNDPALQGSYPYFVVCRNPDFNVGDININMDVEPAHDGYSFSNYGNVECKDVGNPQTVQIY